MRDTWCPFSVTISVCPLQISTSIQNYFCSSVFWRHLWCFNRVRGPLVTAPDLLLYVQYVLCFKTFLFCVQCIQQQSRLASELYVHSVSCTLYTCLLCVHWTILASQLYMHLVTALRVDYPGGYLHRAPCTLQCAPCTMHVAPCTHRAKPHHRQSRGLSRKIWTAPPLLQRPFIPTADAGPASQISIRSDRSL